MGNPRDRALLGVYAPAQQLSLNSKGQIGNGDHCRDYLTPGVKAFFKNKGVLQNNHTETLKRI